MARELDDARPLRRRFLRMTGAVTIAGLAGCTGDGGDGGDGDGGDGGDGDVPSAYETATSQGGQERDPGSLSSQSSVSYQAEPQDGQQCSTCSFYIPDKNDDGLGACAIVEGTIAPDAWCVSYAEYQE